MKTTTYSIPQATSKAQYQTVEDIKNACCKLCGGPMSVEYFHVGGHAMYQPRVICDHRDDCPEREHYIVARIPLQLALDYDELVNMEETDFERWQEAEQEAAS